MSDTLTVKTLKEFIYDLPDDMEVYAMDDEYGGYFQVTEISIIEDEKGKLFLALN